MRLQLLQYQEIFSEVEGDRLNVFGNTVPTVLNGPGCFCFLSLQVMPFPANENPFSILLLHFGQSNISQSIFDLSISTCVFLSILRRNFMITTTIIIVTIMAIIGASKSFIRYYRMMHNASHQRSTKRVAVW